MKITNKLLIQKKKIIDYFYPERRLSEFESIPVVDYSKYQLVAKRGAIGVGVLVFMVVFYQGYVSFAEASAEEDRLAAEKRTKADQVIKKSTQKRIAKVEVYNTQLIDNSGALSGVSQGSLILAKTINKIVSSNSASPVLLEVTEDFQDGSGDTAIESGSKFYGKLSSVEADRVYINIGLIKVGSKSFQVSGDVLSVDGSAGIAGKVNSGKTKVVAGAGVSTFIAGLGAGLMESSTGPWGTTVSGGSLKNGIYNGISQTANHAADIYTEDMKSAVDEITVPSGTHVVILINEAGELNESGLR